MMTWIAIKFIFFPSKVLELYPQQWDLPFEEVFFRAPEGPTLHGWFFPGGPPNRTLIYFHGNAGNIGDRLPKMKILHGLGMNIFIFDYRGYGGSEGEPSFDGVVEDSFAAYRYVLSREDVDPNHIILYGESLGSAFALKIAIQEKHSGIILESAFTSIKDMAKTAYPFIAGIAPDIYRSIETIRHIRQPILILHGKNDRTIPCRMGEELYKAAPHPKRFVGFEGADHSDIYDLATDKYINTIDKFLTEIGE